MLAQVVGAPSSSGFSELGPGPGLGLLGSTLAVLLLLVATLLVLRVVYGARRRQLRKSGLLEVVAQVELSPGQSLYVVRAAGRCLLVGGTSGGLALIAELDPAQVAVASGTALDLGGIAAGTAGERLRARIFGSAVPVAAAVAQAEHTAPPPHAADLKVS